MALNDARPDPTEPSDELAPVDLVWAVDDETHPTQLTVYSDRDGELATHWITMDLEHAVDLAEMA